jgi:hypothetical protein
VDGSADEFVGGYSEVECEDRELGETDAGAVDEV